MITHRPLPPRGGSAAFRLRKEPGSNRSMNPPPKTLDLLARRIMRAAEEDLRHWLGIAQLDHELLGELYIRVRETLERCPMTDRADVEELALTIYLTASAWQSKSEAPVELLLSLHQVIERTLSLKVSRIAP